MIRRNTWILLGIFVVVLAAAYYLQYVREPAEPEATPAAASASEPLFASVESTAVASLHIQNADGKSVQIVRTAEGQWAFAEDTGEQLDSAQAESAVISVVGMTTMLSLNPADDLGVYGLLQPAYEAELTLDGGQKHTLLVGDQVPTGDGYYVRVDGNQPQVVSSLTVENMIGFLDNPPLLPTPTVEEAETSEPGATQQP
jgi:hypothetical protein